MPQRRQNPSELKLSASLSQSQLRIPIGKLLTDGSGASCCTIQASALLTCSSFNRNKLYKTGNFLPRSLLHIGRYEFVWINLCFYQPSKVFLGLRVNDRNLRVTGHPAWLVRLHQYFCILMLSLLSYTLSNLSSSILVMPWDM